MKINYFKGPIVIMILLSVLYCSCKKQDDFLAAKPNEALAVVSSLSDCELLLNNTYAFNINDPYLPAEASEEFTILPSRVANIPIPALASYTWAKDTYAGSNLTYQNGSNSWSLPYSQIFTANVILDALTNIKITSGQQQEYNSVKGMALFYRAWEFYNLLQAYALPYDAESSSTDLGIPLRLSSNLNDKIFRATVQQCYDQVINDVKLAGTLLPATVPYPTQPNKTATNAFLARIYLSMANYTEAYNYADATLKVFHTQYDMNNIVLSNLSLFSTYAPDEIYHSGIRAKSYLITYSTSTEPDSLFLQLFKPNDLRLQAYFLTNPTTGVKNIKASLDYKRVVNFGLETDEIYLIRAECSARAGNTEAAMADLNTLLVNRFLKGTFVPYTAVDANDALGQILLERRKELMFRGVRWSDLRRLNKESRFQVTLSRLVNEITYTLPPNDPRYVLPIPQNEIVVSGIPQNPR